LILDRDDFLSEAKTVDIAVAMASIFNEV